jgi:hypothetical protein
MDIAELEQKHKDVQLICNKALEVAVFAVQQARELASHLDVWANTLPIGSNLESEAEKVFTPDLHAWLEQYRKVAALKFADRVTDTKPKVFAQAMKMLDIIPTIIEKEEK